MDKISELVGLIRQANAWNTLSNEEIIEQALQLLLDHCNHPVVVVLTLDGGEGQG